MQLMKFNSGLYLFIPVWCSIFSFSTRKIALLEISQYLENYLWPNFDTEKPSFAHVMSIVCMINEKHREGVPVYSVKTVQLKT